MNTVCGHPDAPGWWIRLDAEPRPKLCVVKLDENDRLFEDAGVPLNAGRWVAWEDARQAVIQRDREGLRLILTEMKSDSPERQYFQRALERSGVSP